MNSHTWSEPEGTAPDRFRFCACGAVQRSGKKPHWRWCGAKWPDHKRISGLKVLDFVRRFGVNPDGLGDTGPTPD